MQRLFTALLLASFGASSAFAQADSPADDTSSATRADAPVVIHPDVTELDEGDFRDLDIEGRVQGPGMGFIGEPPPSPGFHFIALRTSFDAEMRASLAELD